MKIIGYIFIFLFVAFLVSITFFASFFDKELRYLKYSDNDLEEMFKNAIKRNKDKEVRDLYSQMELRDLICEEKRAMMDLYLRKYDS